ncbi:methyltransferase domain-containing protein [Actinokineospora enzanensis]|uniref:methyltransferase domain-containing protein n=1 Tax=Actinokineospora enzanensis TaxID=155975 RepID=UPI001B7F7A7A|nr:methyltransferase domain-containing protein [Actinokineospora enzanensis]
MDRANELAAYATMRGQLVEALGPLAGRAVLDVGCGTGDDARELAGLVGAGGRVVGVDLSAAMVEEAGRRGGAVEFLVDDLAGLGFADGEFDAVRAKLVLMHCADIDAAARELLRVVRPGGRVAVYDYDFETTTIDHPDVDATREVVRCLADGHANKWSGRQLARRFRDLGARDIGITPLTVVMPYEFYRPSVGGRLLAAQAAGDLRMTADELDAWWRPLEEAAERGGFFASLTGFTLGASR